MRPSAPSWRRRLAWTLVVLVTAGGCGKSPSTSEESSDGGGPYRGSGLSADGTRSKNNLHQIGVALHFYHDVNGCLPPAYLPTKSDGIGLSWRVALLPFIEQNNLYMQFHLDEPWDSEHNLKLLDRMPKLYAPLVSTKEKNVTFYRVVVGRHTAFPPGGRAGGARTLAQISNMNGTSNTIMVVEAAEAVPWTKPDELEFDADKAWPDRKKPPAAKDMPQLGGQFNDGFHALMCDGSVSFFSKDTPTAVLAAVLCFDNVEPVEWYKYTRREEKSKASGPDRGGAAAVGRHEDNAKEAARPEKEAGRPAPKPPQPNR